MYDGIYFLVPAQYLYAYLCTSLHDYAYSHTNCATCSLFFCTRHTGIDVAYHPDKQLNKGRHALLFERCKREKRILVSKSRSLVARRGCPPYALVKGNQTFQGTHRTWNIVCGCFVAPYLVHVAKEGWCTCSVSVRT